MSYDEWDAAQEAYMESLLGEFYETEGPQIAEGAIEGFQEERLQSYFLAHPMLVEPATRQLTNARRFQAHGEHEAALVFAGSATEVALKQALFRPVVYGLVHSEPAAVIIAELSVGHTALDRFKKLLFEILTDFIGTDLRTYRHPGGSATLWEEITRSQEHRNAIVHRGESRSSAEAEIALRCASAVIETLFPAVTHALHLHIHGGVRVCGGIECRGQP